jgi:hypothetical protein
MLPHRLRLQYSCSSALSAFRRFFRHLAAAGRFRFLIIE